MSDNDSSSFSNMNALIVTIAVAAIIWSTGMIESAYISFQHSTNRDPNAVVVAESATTNVFDAPRVARATLP